MVITSHPSTTITLPHPERIPETGQIAEEKPPSLMSPRREDFTDDKKAFHPIRLGRCGSSWFHLKCRHPDSECERWIQGRCNRGICAFCWSEKMNAVGAKIAEVIRGWMWEGSGLQFMTISVRSDWNIQTAVADLEKAFKRFRRRASDAKRAINDRRLRMKKLQKAKRDPDVDDPKDFDARMLKLGKEIGEHWHPWHAVKSFIGVLECPLLENGYHPHYHMIVELAPGHTRLDWRGLHPYWNQAACGCDDRGSGQRHITPGCPPSSMNFSQIRYDRGDATTRRSRAVVGYLTKYCSKKRMGKNGPEAVYWGGLSQAEMERVEGFFVGRHFLVGNYRIEEHHGICDVHSERWWKCCTTDEGDCYRDTEEYYDRVRETGG